MTPLSVACWAAVALGWWAAGLGAAVILRAAVGLVQDRGSALLVRWWLQDALLAGLAVAVGAGLAVWARGMLP